MRVGGFELSVAARRVVPWPPRKTLSILSAILLLSAVLGVCGLDWGLPYGWHPDEKIMVADVMVTGRTLEPPHFINPSLHVYVTYAAVRLAYALEPRLGIRYRAAGAGELTDPNHPDRGLQMLAFRLTRLQSVLFQLATVCLLFTIGRHVFDDATGLLAAWFGAAAMGLVNMAHFATGESLLFLLCLWALWRFSLVAERGSWRDYVLAGVATGLACSTKYTPFLLAVPFLVAHLSGRGWRHGLSPAGLARMAVTMACTIGAFIATTPYSVLAWSKFRHALIVTWFTGAPGGSLAHVERSWVPYIDILGNSLGWPLFVLSLVGLVFALLRALTPGTEPRLRSWYLVHASWAIVFYAFYGITFHRALRFIMPIGPSLVLLAAAAGMSFVRSAPGRIPRLAALTAMLAIGVYSTAYSARAVAMFVGDTRYAAGRWLQSLPLPAGMTVDHFTIESYLPYFDRPPFAVRDNPFVLDDHYRGSDFWKEVLPYLENPANGVIVDSDAFYPRYLILSEQARLPDRVRLYRMLFSGEGSPFRLAARFVSHGPWWLDPRPELVAPEIVVFATRTAIPDTRAMSPLPPPRDDVRAIGGR
jgi:hypothetical protein